MNKFIFFCGTVFGLAVASAVCVYGHDTEVKLLHNFIDDHWDNLTECPGKDSVSPTYMFPVDFRKGE